MRWPSKSTPSDDILAIAYDGESFCHLRATRRAGAAPRLGACGIEQRGDDPLPEFARRLRALALPSQEVIAVLPLAHCQLLQIPTPPVPPEEMKAAARWGIKDLVDVPLDELTLDVMQVGDGRARAQRHSFVAAAYSHAIATLGRLCQLSGLSLRIVDICESAQRNLQCALAHAQGHPERATALLVRHGAHCVLTISANDELFHARRLAWSDELLEHADAHLLSRPLAWDDSQRPAPADDSHGSPAGGDETPALLVELQRSFDAWEHAWPELPLERVVVDAGVHSHSLASLIGRQLGRRVDTFELAPVLGAAPTRPLPGPFLPLVGALLRGDVRLP